MKHNSIQMLVLALSCLGSAFVNASSMAECANIAANEARLACFDALTNQGTAPNANNGDVL